MPDIDKWEFSNVNVCGLCSWALWKAIPQLSPESAKPQSTCSISAQGILCKSA